VGERKKLFDPKHRGVIAPPLFLLFNDLVYDSIEGLVPSCLLPAVTISLSTFFSSSRQNRRTAVFSV
jgi:hypothetical protein